MTTTPPESRASRTAGPAFYTWLSDELAARSDITSFADLRRAAGVTEATFSRWKRGQIAPSVDHCRRLGAALGIPILELMVAAEVVTPHEARQQPREQMSNGQLIALLTTRLADPPAGPHDDTYPTGSWVDPAAQVFGSPAHHAALEAEADSR